MANDRGPMEAPKRMARTKAAAAGVEGLGFGVWGLGFRF